MNENNAEVPLPEASGAENPVLETSVPETPVVETPAPSPAPAPAKPKGGSKIVWIVGCGILLCLCAALIVALVYFGLPLIQGDPIVSVVPNDSLMYFGVDLAQTRSERFGDMVAIVQELADEDKDQTLTESLDKFMEDEYDMSFTEDVMPWVGRHAAFVVTEGDFSSGDIKMMLILETRNKEKADKFLSEFVDATRKHDDTEFEQRQENGVTFYVYEDTSNPVNDEVLARVGKFIYLSNSQDTILESASLQKKDSLAGSQGYKDAIRVLPRNRLATVYVTGETLSEAMQEMSGNVYGRGLSYPSYMTDLTSQSLIGMAISLSVQQEGLRMDAAVVYDETKISGYQKEVLATEYLAPTTAALLPEDTFLFIGTNTSQAPSSYTEIDNPLYSGDVEESFDLLEQQYGIDIRALVDLLGGEFAFALGPANDGLFAEEGNVNIGFTMLAGTSDEAAFIGWFENALNKLITEDMYMEYDIRDTKIGDYDLKELTLQQGSESSFSFIYGADNGYIVLGSSPSILEDGFTGTNTLAQNEMYRRTWSAFPARSVPYMYLNLGDFMDFLTENADEFGGTDVFDTQKKLQKIPVVAMSMSNRPGHVRSVTLIVFVEKNK